MPAWALVERQQQWALSELLERLAAHVEFSFQQRALIGAIAADANRLRRNSDRAAAHLVNKRPPSASSIIVYQVSSVGSLR
jgi:hypothetical protein